VVQIVKLKSGSAGKKRTDSEHGDGDNQAGGDEEPDLSDGLPEVRQGIAQR
jgi:hypothetical protein